MTSKETTLGWGKVNSEGAEIWDTKPTFIGEHVTWKDKLKLLFYPKKFLLYRYIIASFKHKNIQSVSKEPFRILDIGCGTGASVVDLKKLFGRSVEVHGIDVVRLQVELAEKKIKQHGVWSQVQWYDGLDIPYPDNHFDAVYTSDVLGHVQDVPAWLAQMHTVLKPGGVLAMFSESQLGKHAWIRKHFMTRGFNVDPHAQFHISLYSKKDLRDVLTNAGFAIHRMYAGIWPYFFLYPEECHERLQKEKRFFFLKALNRMLYWLKKKTHPYSTAAVELYALFEMMTLGRFIESQGYVILGKKREE